MHRPNPTITEIYYLVIADYNRPPRRGSAVLRQIAQAYEDAVDMVKAKSVTEDGKKEPTHQQVMKELALNPPSPHLFDAMLAVSAKSGENWSKVHERVVVNQQLWEFEDENIPLALRIRYYWIENGVLVGPVEETVSIVLPSSLAAKFEL